MNRMIWPSASVTSLSTALSRSSNSPRILRAGDERAQVERDESLVLQAFGHVAVDDALRQAFDDGGLADAGLADQHRIVLGPARQHLDHAADLLVAADHRIELALAREVGQIAAILFQGLIFFFWIRIGDALRAANADQGVENFIASCAQLLEDFPSFAAVLHNGQQQVLGGDILVFQGFGFGLAAFDNFLEPWRDIALAAGAGHLRQTVEGFLQSFGHLGQRYAKLLQQRQDHAFLLSK